MEQREQGHTQAAGSLTLGLKDQDFKWPRLQPQACTSRGLAQRLRASKRRVAPSLGPLRHPDCSVGGSGPPPQPRDPTSLDALGLPGHQLACVLSRSCAILEITQPSSPTTHHVGPQALKAALGMYRSLFWEGEPIPFFPETS